MNIQHCRASQFATCEFGVATTVPNNAVAIFSGIYTSSPQTITGTNVVKAGNFNIS